jgi:hypothetical protein
MESGKAYADVGEANKQFKKLKFNPVQNYK